MEQVEYAHQKNSSNNSKTPNNPNKTKFDDANSKLNKFSNKYALTPSQAQPAKSNPSPSQPPSVAI
jgi:hypothetical protein